MDSQELPMCVLTKQFYCMIINYDVSYLKIGDYIPHW
jgi:hypothetical protein